MWINDEEVSFQFPAQLRAVLNMNAAVVADQQADDLATTTDKTGEPNDPAKGKRAARE